MAITHVAETSGVLTAADVLTLPGTPLEDDIVIFMAAGDGSLEIPLVLTSGYDYPHASYDGAAQGLPGFSVMWKRLGSSPDSSISVDHGGGTVAYQIHVFRGVDTTTAIDAAASAVSNSAGTPNPPSLDTITNGAMRIAWGALDDDDSTVSGLSTFDDFLGSNTGQGSTTVGSTIMLAWRLEATAGTLDPDAFSVSSSDAWWAGHFALRPAAGGEEYDESLTIAASAGLSPTPAAVASRSLSVGTSAGLDPVRTVSAPRSLSVGASVGDTQTSLASLLSSLSLSAELEQTETAIVTLLSSLSVGASLSATTSSLAAQLGSLTLAVSPGASNSTTAVLSRSLSWSLLAGLGTLTDGSDDVEMLAQLVARASASLGTAVSSDPGVALDTTTAALSLSLLSGTSAGRDDLADVTLVAQLVAVAAASMGTTASLAESALHGLHVETVIATVVGVSPPNTIMSMGSLLVLDVQAEALTSGGFTLTGTIELPVSVGQEGDSNPATAVAIEFALEVGAETARQLSAAASLELAVSSALSWAASATSQAALQIAIAAVMDTEHGLEVDRAIEIAVDASLSEHQQLDRDAAILLTVHSTLSTISMLIGDTNITTHVALAGVRHGSVGLTGTARLRVALRGLARLRVDLPDSEQ